MRSTCGRVESRLAVFLRSLDLAENEVVLVAYSGGPDSTALLAAAARFRPTQLLAVHVDHGIRPEPERAAEEILVKEFCAGLGVRLVVAHIRPGAVAAAAARRRCGVEAAARAYRFRIFRKLLGRESSSHLLLAHTRDDQIETALMHLLGGSGSMGLRGIAERNPPWYRPFLEFGKGELFDYDRELDLPYSTDSTNASTMYLRNRLRHRLLPFLDSEFPGWRRGLTQTIERAKLDSRLILDCAGSIAFRPASEGMLVADADAFFSEHEACQLASLLEAVRGITGRERVGLRLARAAIAAVGRGAADGGGRYKGGGIELLRRGDELLLSRGLDFPRRGGYFVVVDRVRRVECGGFVVEAVWTSAEGQGIRSDAFLFPIVVRSHRPGDSIVFRGGGKRLDDLFTEWGLAADIRALVPVVEDRSGIVAVLGSAFGARDRYRELPMAKDGEMPRLAIIVKGA